MSLRWFEHIANFDDKALTIVIKVNGYVDAQESLWGVKWRVGIGDVGVVVGSILFQCP